MYKKILIYILIAIGLLGIVSLLVVLFANNIEEKTTEDETTEEVAPTVPEEGQLSTFTIDGVEYQYEVGMDWTTWDLSDYNVDNLIERKNDVKVHIGLKNDDTDSLCLCLGNYYVLWDSKIQSLNYIIKEYSNYSTFTFNGNEYEFEIGRNWDYKSYDLFCFVDDPTGSHLTLKTDTSYSSRLYFNDELVCRYDLLQTGEYIIKTYDGPVLEEGQTSTFTLDGVSYVFVIGTSWNTWIASDYNTDDLVCTRTDSSGPGVGLTDDINKRVYLSDTIVSNYNIIQPGVNYITK